MSASSFYLLLAIYLAPLLQKDHAFAVGTVALIFAVIAAIAEWKSRN